MLGRRTARSIGWVAAIVLLTGSGGTSPTAPLLGLADGTSIKTTAWCLPSGLRVLFEQRTGRDDVSLVTVIDAGSVEEPPGLEGLAHLVEHLWFRTSHSGYPSIEAFAEATGSSANGATRHDTTTYTTLGNRRNIRSLLSVEADRLQDPLAGIDEATFQVEREIVRNELRMRILDTGGLGFAAVQAALFPGDHPYGRPVAGSNASLDRITLADTRTFAAEHYQPDRATVLLQGDFRSDAVERLLAELPEAVRAAPAGSEGPGCPSRAVQEDLPTPDPGLHEIEAAVDVPEGWIGWTVPPGDDAAAIAELAIRAGTRYLEERLGDVECDVDPRRLATVVLCRFAVSDPEKTPKVVRAAVENLHQTWEKSSAWNLHGVAGKWASGRRTRLFLDLEDIDGETSSIASAEASWFHETGDERWFDHELAQTRQDGIIGAVQAFGERWLTPERVATAIAMPGGRAQDVPMVEVHAGRSEPAVAEGIIDADRLAELVPDPDLDGLEVFDLPNGLKVVLVPFGDLPIARLRLVVPAGSRRADPPALDVATWRYAGVAHGSTYEGPSAMSWVPNNPSLASAAAAIAGRWTSHAGPAAWQIGVDGGNPLAQVYLMRRRVDTAAEVNLVKTRWNQKMAFEGAQTPFEVATIEQGRHLAPGNLWWLDPAELPRVPPRDIEIWTRRVLRPDGATLIAVGGFDPAAMRTEITRWFASWHAPPRLPPPGPARAVAVAPQDDRVALIPIERTTQAEITLMCQVGFRSPDDVAPSLVATWLRSTLWEALRTHTGQTYGVSTWLDGDALVLRTRVPNAVAARVVGQVRDQLRAADTVDEGVLGQIAAASARRAALAFQSTEQVVERLAAEAEAGVPPASTMTGRAARLAAVDLAAFRAVLGPCADHEIVTIVGAASVADDLRAASIAVDVVDPPAPTGR